MNIEDCPGFKLGYENAYKKVMQGYSSTENPFEPMTFEYENYWDGLYEGEKDAKAKKFKNKISRIK